jgi:hypothetical protein
MVCTIACLLILCLTAQLYSLWVLEKKLDISAQTREGILSCPEEVVLTNIWWMPQDMAGAFYEKTFLHPKTEKDRETLLEALKAKGVKSYLFITGDQGPWSAPLFRAETDLKLFQVAIYRQPIR